MKEQKVIIKDDDGFLVNPFTEERTKSAIEAWDFESTDEAVKWIQRHDKYECAIIKMKITQPDNSKPIL